MKDLVETKTNSETEKFREKTDILELLKKGEFEYENIKESYDSFLYREKEYLEKIFYEENDFQTTVQGIKVRGVYDTLKEAEIRAKVLRKRDKNFHVFVGQVGYWLPWNPEADTVSNQEYQESNLNTLVKKYNENKESRDDMYEQLKREKIEKARKKTKEQRQKENMIDIDEKETDDKINTFRELLTEKDGQYDELMDSKKTKESDPWMQRKIEDNEKK
jgi:hypothetical protein